jgi:glycosyltransferase involved in cell wall biosynthesis
MVVRNGMPWIQRAVESVLAQTWPHIEIIVQDGQSNDGTLEYLLSLGDKIDLVSQKDSGPDEGFHLAIRRCTGDIIGSCLADEALLPDAAENIVSYFNQNPFVGVVIGITQIVDIEHSFIRNFVTQPFDMVRYLETTYMPSFAASFYRRDALLTTGLHDNNWIAFCFEKEFWFRMACEWTIGIIDVALSKYAAHRNALSSSVHEHRLYQTQGLIELIQRAFADNGILGKNDVLETFCLNATCQKAKHHFTVLNNNTQYDTSKALNYIDKFLESLQNRISHQINFVLPNILSIFPSYLPTDQRILLYFSREMANFHRLRGQLLQSLLYTNKILEIFWVNLIKIGMNKESQQNKTFEKGIIRSTLLGCKLALMTPSYSEYDQKSLQHEIMASIPELESPIDKRLPKKSILTLGYICPSTLKNDASNLIFSLEKFYDPSRYKVILFVSCRDDITLFSEATEIHVIDHLSQNEFSQLVINLSVDILISMADFEENLFFTSMITRLAPIQVNFGAHYGTTAMQTIDWILTDHYAKANLKVDDYCEQFYCLEHNSFCYNSRFLEELEHPLTETHNKTIILGNLSKADHISEDLISHWSDILLSIPDSRLFLRHDGLNRQVNCNYIERHFEFYGISKDRLLLNPSASPYQFTIDCQMIDIILDSWPYADRTMVARSLYQGLPTITLVGDRLASRTSASLLHQAGLDDFIAHNWEDYKQKTITLAKSPDRLSHYRKTLRSRLVEQGLMDEIARVRQIESAYEGMIKGSNHHNFSD